MKSRFLLAVSAGILFIALLLWSSLRDKAVRVEVCVTYAGKQACRTARGTTEREARETAQQNACGLLARGMTDSIACQEKTPDTVRVLP